MCIDKHIFPAGYNVNSDKNKNYVCFLNLTVAYLFYEVI